MAVATWTTDFTLTSPLGTFDIPAVMLVPGSCSAGASIRDGGSDPVPAGDGMIVHPQRFKNGYQMHLVLQLIDGGVMLTDSELQDFVDGLDAHLDVLLSENGRIEWDVPGMEARMLSNIRTLEMPGPSGNLPKQYEFSVESPFPYAWTTAGHEDDLSDGVPLTIDRGGSKKEFFPVVRVEGPTDAFTITNALSGLVFSYDSSREDADPIASGHYAEIDFFRKTIVRDGDVTYLSEGVVWETADFWPLTPGEQDVQLDGADGTILWNDAWA